MKPPNANVFVFQVPILGNIIGDIPSSLEGLRHETLKHAGNGPLWPRYKVRKYEWNVVRVTGNWQKWQDSGLYINIK